MTDEAPGPGRVRALASCSPPYPTVRRGGLTKTALRVIRQHRGRARAEACEFCCPEGSPDPAVTLESETLREVGEGALGAQRLSCL